MAGGKIIFSTSSYDYLADEIAGISQAERGRVNSKIFPDGEFYQRIMNDVEDRDVVLAGGTISDNDSMELYDLACGLVSYGAKSLTLVVPFFGYSTMERAVKSGEVVKAKTRALLFSSVPSSPRGNKILLLDLHTEGLPYYFEGTLRPVHLYGKKIVMNAVKELSKNEVVIASTDAGRAKWVESLANDMDLNAAFILKRRISGEETMVTSISADVKNKDVVIYDDMIRTGGSIVNAAQAYKDAGANDIFVITTHGLFTDNGLEKIKRSGYVKKVIATNSHPNAVKIKDPFLEVKSIASVIEENLDKHLYM